MFRENLLRSTFSEHPCDVTFSWLFQEMFFVMLKLFNNHNSKTGYFNVGRILKIKGQIMLHFVG